MIQSKSVHEGEMRFFFDIGQQEVAYLLDGIQEGEFQGFDSESISHHLGIHNKNTPQVGLGFFRTEIFLPSWEIYQGPKRNKDSN